MTGARFSWRSLQTRVTIFTLSIFIVSLWILAFYGSRTLRGDMQTLLGAQQFSTTSLLAAEVNESLAMRLGALDKASSSVAAAMPAGAAAVQVAVNREFALQALFNGGVLAYDVAGKAIAEVPRSVGRLGVDYSTRDYLIGALREGKATFGKPVVGPKLGAPVFVVAVPLRGAEGRIVGALGGVVNLASSNFLDRITESRYGQSGGYLLVAPQHRLVVTATDKRRIMETLPAIGVNPLIDLFLEGYEGSTVLVNPLGVEVLVSSKQVPVAGWHVVTTIPTAEAFAPIVSMQRRMLAAAFFLTLLVGGLTWWLLRQQLSPMLSAAKTLGALADSTQALHPLPIERHDEVGELLGGFNRLLGVLGEREEALKASEAFKLAILNSVAAEIAVVDGSGTILAVNEPWRRFARDNPPSPDAPAPGTDIGTNYLAVCERAEGGAADGALAAREGILAVLAGRLPSFSMEYPCHAPDSPRWFTMSVLPLGPDPGLGVAITHSEITRLKSAEEQLRVAAVAFESRECMLVTDAKGIILRINRAFTEVTGFTPTTSAARPRAF